MARARALRYLWAAPATLVGLACTSLASRGGIALVDGVIEAHGPRLRWALAHLVPLEGRHPYVDSPFEREAFQRFATPAARTRSWYGVRSVM